MNHKDNPAGRLYLLITNVRGQGPDTAHGQAWRKAVSAADESDAIFLQRMAGVHRIPAQVRALIPKVSAIDIPPIHKAMDQVESVLTNFNSNNVKWVISKVDQGHVDLLHVISSELSQQFPEPVVEEVRLEALMNEVKSLYQQVQDADDLTPREKEHLLDLLDVLGNAIVEMDIGGAASLRSAAYESFGAIIADSIAEGTNPWRKKIAGVTLFILFQLVPWTIDVAQIPPTVDWWLKEVEVPVQLESPLPAEQQEAVSEDERAASDDKAADPTDRGLE